MKKITMFLLILFICLALQAKSPYPMNNVSVDLGAPGSLVTVSYDRYLFRSEMHALSINAGAGTILTCFSFPVGVDYAFGQQHQLLTGIHFTPCFGNGNVSLQYTSFMSLKLGYRYHFQIFKNCPMFYQVYLSPSYNVLDMGLIWFATVGFGFDF